MENIMKESDYVFLLSNIFLAQFMGRGLAAVAWIFYMALFGGLLYLGR
jgi:hypothetical protein